MNDDGQQMPSFDALCTKVYSLREWLTYYLNIWQRNLMASMTDAMHDSLVLAADAGALTEGQQDLVPDGKGGARQKTMAERLEQRKAQAQRANSIIAAVNALLALSDDDLAAKAATDSDFLKAVAPQVESPLTSYIVADGKTITVSGTDYAAGATVSLDPTDQQTIDWLADGSITAAPTV
jgi:hypothetical protein